MILKVRQNVSFLKIQFGVVDDFKLNVLVEKMKFGLKMENC
jgi:hypothetical protein